MYIKDFFVIVDLRFTVNSLLISYVEHDKLSWIQCVLQGRSQDFSKGGAEVMEAKALKRKNCL